MRSDPENSERFVLCSERIVLECKCGESLVLLGLEEDWQSERTVFDCECGESLTLANRPAEEALAIKKLLRSGLGIPALEPYDPSPPSIPEQHHDESLERVDQKSSIADKDEAFSGQGDATHD